METDILLFISLLTIDVLFKSDPLFSINFPILARSALLSRQSSSKVNSFSREFTQMIFFFPHFRKEHGIFVLLLEDWLGFWHYQSEHMRWTMVRHFHWPLARRELCCSLPLRYITSANIVHSLFWRLFTRQRGWKETRTRSYLQRHWIDCYE